MKHKHNIAEMMSRSSSDSDDLEGQRNKIENDPLLNKHESGGIKDEEEDNLALTMLTLQLELMGFKKQMIEALFESEDVIEDANHAADLLLQGHNGWTHKFAKNPFT